MKTRVIKCKGKILFEPEDKTTKHKSQSSWKRVALVLTGDDMADYYSWFINKRYNLKLNRPLRGTHVTFINDKESEVPLFKRAKGLYDGKQLTFYIDPSPRSNGEHWWLRVWSPQMERIRKTAGGNPIPHYAFHLTLGYANPKNIEHSKYIVRCTERWEESSIRPDFGDCEIISLPDETLS